VTVSMRIVIGFVLVLVLSTVVAIVGWQALEQSDEGFDLERRGLLALGQVDDAVKTELRGRLAKDQDISSAIQERLTDVRETLAGLQDNPELREAVSEAHGAVDRYWREHQTFTERARAVDQHWHELETLVADLTAVIATVVADSAERQETAAETAHQAFRNRDRADVLGAAMQLVTEGVVAASQALDRYRQENTEGRARQAQAEIKVLGNGVQALIDVDAGEGSVDAEALAKAVESLTGGFAAFDAAAAEARDLMAARDEVIADLDTQSEGLVAAISELKRDQEERLGRIAVRTGSVSAQADLMRQRAVLAELEARANRVWAEEQRYLRSPTPDQAHILTDLAEALDAAVREARAMDRAPATTSPFQVIVDATEAYRETLARAFEIADTLETARLAQERARIQYQGGLRSLKAKVTTAEFTVDGLAETALQDTRASIEALDAAQTTIRAADHLSVQAAQARAAVFQFIDHPEQTDASVVRALLEDAREAQADLIERVGAESSARAEDLTVAFGGRMDRLVETFQEVETDVAGILAAEDGMRLAGRTMEAALGAARDEARERGVEERGFAQTLLTIGAILALVIGLAVAVLIGRSITRPLTAITDAMKRLADNDLMVEVPGRARRDEIGHMAAAVEVFKENSQKIEHMQAEQAAQARRNARRVKAEMMALTNALDEEVRAAISIVHQQANAMHEAALEMTEAVAHTGQRSDAAAGASRAAAGNVDSVAAAAEELAGSIKEISRQVDGASGIASRAVQEAESTNQRIEGLAEAADQIGEVVNMISDIAKQTNLLALNATIEAARAGEAGKGFGVVANEVKTLANQTAKATEDIASQVGAMQSATREAVEAIQSIVAVIGEMNEITTAVSAAVEEQTASTSEISKSAVEGARSTQEASENISEVSTSAEVTGGHAQDVQQSALEVRERVDQMLKSLERIIRSGSEEDRDLHGMRTVNIAVTVDLGDGAERACLLQDMAPSGVGTLDRSITGDRGREFTVTIPDLGAMPATIVARTETNTHIRLDVPDARVEAVARMVRDRVAGKGMAA